MPYADVIDNKDESSYLCISQLTNPFTSSGILLAFDSEGQYIPGPRFVCIEL